MTNDASLSSAATDLSKSRGWLIAGGFLSIFVGFSAIGSPLLFSLVIAQLLGLLFGTNLIFNGSSLFALRLAARKPVAA